MVGSWQAPFKAVLVPVRPLGSLSRSGRLAVQPHCLYFFFLLMVCQCSLFGLRHANRKHPPASWQPNRIRPATLFFSRWMAPPKVSVSVVPFTCIPNPSYPHGAGDVFFPSFFALKFRIPPALYSSHALRFPPVAARVLSPTAPSSPATAPAQAARRSRPNSELSVTAGPLDTRRLYMCSYWGGGAGGGEKRRWL